MIIDTDPLCDMDEQWFISLNNIILKYSVYACVNSSIQSLLHIIFIKSVYAGGKDDR
jgi:hypothetical protein